jgi:hypothetical protein
VTITAESVNLQVAQGQNVTMPVTITGVPSTVTQVTATCLNLPTGASCTYDSSSKTVTILTSPSTPKGTYQIVVVFTLTQQTAALSHTRLLLAMLGPGIGLPFGLLWMGGRRRKRLHWGVLVLIAVMMILSLAGCGGHSGQTSTTQQQSSLPLTLTIS